jgi:hypothetical protein
VPGALRRHAQARLTGEVDHCDDVGVRARERDRGGSLVDGEVPRAPRLVPAGVAWSVDLAMEAAAEGVDVGEGRSVISMAPRSALRRLTASGDP